ncbi:MAG: DedA family protein [Solirubrobacteraceae bacterium]
MFDSLLHAISGSAWTYLLVLGVCAGDAVLPLFPSETVVITASVLAAQGKLNIALVVPAAAIGALIGDNTAYWLGRGGLSRITDRLLGSEKNQERLRWARGQLRRHGAWIIIIGRFIPGGRTATTYVSGTLEMPWKRRFLPFDSIAAVLWAAYASALGYFGGSAFQNNLWVPLLVASGIGVLVAGAGELLRRYVLDRGQR